MGSSWTFEVYTFSVSRVRGKEPSIDWTFSQVLSLLCDILFQLITDTIAMLRLEYTDLYFRKFSAKDIEIAYNLCYNLHKHTNDYYIYNYAEKDCPKIIWLFTARMLDDRSTWKYFFADVELKMFTAFRERIER